MAAILEVRDLHYYYGNIHAVKGISLHVDEGEIVTIIGSNGAGKTTLLQTISGLTDPRGVQGQILFCGKDIARANGYKISRQGIAHCLEGRHVFPKLTVEENILMGACSRKSVKHLDKDVQEIYERFPRLLERRDQMAGTLSGGEQQMLAIGRALIARPKLILFDEPSLGLAPIIVKGIYEAILEINRAGTTILFVEQNSKIALETANRAYVMQTGEVVIQGTAQDLMHDPEIQKAYLGI